jgi:hypothetical protein
MSARFCQLDNNGWKLTNELGWILQDRAFSVVQAREVSQCSDCFCPSKQVACLRVPCDLLSAKCQNVTIPLFDAKTRAPFKIQRGTIITDLIILKRRGACIDNCMCFLLGTIAGDECCDPCAAQRWVSESCPVSGAQLNKCGAVSVDVSRNNRLNCPLYLCKAGGCPGTCERVDNFTQEERPCDGGLAGPTSQQPDKARCGCDSESGECPCVLQDGNGCCTFPGGCGQFGGELADSMIGITVTSGDLRANDILIAVESWQRCCLDDCEDDEEDVCANVPRWTYGGY